MMTTDMKNYIPDCKEFRNEFRDIMEGQYEHDLYNKSFGGEDRFSVSFILTDKTKSWNSIIEMLGGTIPNNVFDYTFEEMQYVRIKACQAEQRELGKRLRNIRL